LRLGSIESPFTTTILNGTAQRAKTTIIHIKNFKYFLIALLLFAEEELKDFCFLPFGSFYINFSGNG
jgi:hypothetical protein